MLDNFPTNLHPMSQFSAAITALNSESSFARAYSEGVHKSKYWEVSLLSRRPAGGFTWGCKLESEDFIVIVIYKEIWIDKDTMEQST